MNPAQMMDGPPDWGPEEERGMREIAAREQAAADAEIITDQGVLDKRVRSRAVSILAAELQKHGIFGGMVSCLAVADALVTAVDNARAEAACQLKQEDRDAVG